jgi:ADP-heptose:LPS heptosyltransferase
MGDVLLAGPAVRALAARGWPVTFLAGPAGASAARLLPGVTRILRWAVPWIDPEPAAFDRRGLRRLVRAVRRVRPAEAVVFTSFHQSPLPMALALRLAGVPRLSAISDDYPGSLLDVRHQITADVPEPERNLSLARAAGFGLPPGDPGTLAVRGPLPDSGALTGGGPYIVLHPGASVPARRPAPSHTGAIAAALASAGHRVVVTGSAAEGRLAAEVCAAADQATGRAPGQHAAGPLNLCGRTGLPMLASVLAGAQVVVAPNTGTAHLAAAVGVPVVSLFAPVVPAARWAPYGVPTVLLGDQEAPCAGSRARSCPVPGHPCLDTIGPADVVTAVAALAGTAVTAAETAGATAAGATATVGAAG